MAERPILFSAPMVRAILAGHKSQTRRVMKPQPLGGAPTLLQHLLAHGHQRWATDEPDEEWVWKCPYGAPGDRLWVREAWTTHACFDNVRAGALTTRSLHYQADGKIKTGRNRAAMHMPRWASRITLEITEVRVERLQDISNADSLAEGIVRLPDGGCGLADGSHYHATYPRQSYLGLFEAINGPGSVEANPWVWVMGFKRVEVTNG